MSIRQVNDFSVGDVNLTSMMETLNKAYKGKMNVTLSNYSGTGAPVVKVGSVFDNNGSTILVETGDETPSGYAAMAVSTTFYLTYDESAEAFVYLQAAPTWSDALQGWYVGNDRYLFSMYKDSGGTLYENKAQFIQSDNKQLWNKITVQAKGSNVAVCGRADCCGVYGTATTNCGVYGNAVTYGVYGCATSDCGVYGKATCNVGVYGIAHYSGVLGCATCNYGVRGVAACCYGVCGYATGVYAIYGCAGNCGVYGRAGGSHGVYGYSPNRYGVYGSSTCCGVYGTITTSYPVVGNGAYYNASTKYLKQPTENICLTNCLLKTPLPMYKWRWEDENQRGFDEFVAPYAEDLVETFNLTERDDGYYTTDGIALGLGIELLKEIQFLKKRIKTLEENK